MRIGIILTAGKQTRFLSNNLKCLMPYLDSTVLEENIKTMEKFTDIIYLVTNKDNNKYFENIKFKNNVKILILNKYGLGNGDSLLRSLSMINLINVTQCFLIWSDSIINISDLYSNCIKAFNLKLTIPLQFINNPYLDFKLNKFRRHYIISDVNYDSIINRVGGGYHDFSIFLFNPKLIKFYLQSLYNKHWNDKELKYNNLHNNELKFFDILKDTKINKKLLANAIILNNLNSNNSFNTIEEYENLIKGENKNGK